MIDQRIIDSFQETKSVKKTAAQLGISVIKVRRNLITAGLWRSRRSEAVCALLEQGLTLEETADELHVSVKNVESYAPYKQGPYGKEDVSPFAARCKDYRDRKRNALSKQIHTTQSGNKHNEQKEVSDMVTQPTANSTNRKTVHLHMELRDSRPAGEEDLPLIKYGKVRESISRDILVPSSITLHALHYVIQKAFGWQNSHLHHFELPEETYRTLTGGMFRRWGELCGIFFRMPTEDFEDLYWDDDYDGTKSFRNWLRKKYCGPYSYGGYSELYLECQKELLTFYQHCPKVDIRVSFETFRKNPDGKMIEKRISPKEATIDELQRSVDFGGNLQSLLERLTLADIMYLGNETAFPDLNAQLVEAVPVTDELLYLYDYGDGWEVEITYVEDSEEATAHPEVAAEEKPLCVALDGLNVMDDVGGISGYCDFLHNLHSNDPDEAEGLREWARMQGWTGRSQKPEKLL